MLHPRACLPASSAAPACSCIVRARSSRSRCCSRIPEARFLRAKMPAHGASPRARSSRTKTRRRCALREFEEETGIRAGEAQLLHLGEIQQRGGKRVEAWAFAGEWAGGRPNSNTFEMEWPPRSGKKQSFPEIDRLGVVFTCRSATEAQPGADRVSRPAGALLDAALGGWV